MNPTTTPDRPRHGLVARLAAGHPAPDDAVANLCLHLDDHAEDTLARLRATLADRADADDLLDVAYRTVDSAYGPLLVAATAPAWSGSPSSGRTTTPCSGSWPPP